MNLFKKLILPLLFLLTLGLFSTLSIKTAIADVNCNLRTSGVFTGQEYYANCGSSQDSALSKCQQANNTSCVITNNNGQEVQRATFATDPACTTRQQGYGLYETGYAANIPIWTCQKTNSSSACSNTSANYCNYTVSINAYLDEAPYGGRHSSDSCTPIHVIVGGSQHITIPCGGTTITNPIRYNFNPYTSVQVDPAYLSPSQITHIHYSDFYNPTPNGKDTDGPYSIAPLAPIYGNGTAEFGVKVSQPTATPTPTQCSNSNHNGSCPSGKVCRNTSMTGYDYQCVSTNPTPTPTPGNGGGSCKSCADLGICGGTIGPGDRGAGCSTISCRSQDCKSGTHCSTANQVCIPNSTYPTATPTPHGGSCTVNAPTLKPASGVNTHKGKKGEQLDYEVVLHNASTCSRSFTLNPVSPPSGWTVTFSDNNPSGVSSDGSLHDHVYITSDTHASPNHIYDIKVQATDSNSSSAKSNILTLHYEVKSGGGTGGNPTATPTTGHRSPTATPTPHHNGNPTATPTPGGHHGNPTNTPTPRPTHRPTATPTPERCHPTCTGNKVCKNGVCVRPTNTPTPTPTSVPQTGTRLHFDLGLDTIGAAGDSVNPDPSGSNKNPQHTQRDVSVGIFDNNEHEIAPYDGTVTYDTSSGKFSGVVQLDNQIKDGSYIVKVSSAGFLNKRVPGFFNIVKGQRVDLPSVILVNGDINGDNIIDAKDFNIFRSCSIYSKDSTACGENVNYYQYSDLNDDGIVDDIDQTFLQREWITKHGD